MWDRRFDTVGRVIKGRTGIKGLLFMFKYQHEKISVVSAIKYYSNWSTEYFFQYVKLFSYFRVKKFFQLYFLLFSKLNYI